MNGAVGSEDIGKAVTKPMPPLPSELLCIIFQYVQSAALVSNITKIYDWLAITRVCKLWRDVAVSHSRLWSTLDIDTNKALHLFLERARLNPLAIYCSLPSVFDKFESIVLEHSHHMSELQLFSRPSTFIPAISILSNAAPRLKILLLSYDILARTAPIVPLPYRTLSPKIISEAMPNLRELYLLANYSFHWTPVGNNLRALAILNRWQSFGVPFRDAIPPSIADVLECLRLMPMLEYLELDCSFSPSSHDIAEVSLPHLMHALLSSTTGECLGIWQHINPHSSMIYELTCDGGRGVVVQDVKASLTNFHELPWCELPDTLVFSTLSYKVGDFGLEIQLRDPSTNRYAKFKRFETSSSIPARSHLSSKHEYEPIACTFSATDLDSDPLVILSAVCEVTNEYHYLTLLELEGDLQLSSDQWMSILNSCPYLYGIWLVELPGWSIKELFLLLTLEVDGASESISQFSDDSVASSIPLPHLTSLILWCISLSGPQSGPQDDAVLHQLLTMLASRKDAGHGLEDLTIYDSNVAQEDITKMEAFVTRWVEWDGEVDGVQQHNL